MIKQDFWVTCPTCQQKFSVPLAVIVKYLQRLKSEAGQRLAKLAKELGEAARQKLSSATSRVGEPNTFKEVAPPDNLPVKEVED